MIGCLEITNMVKVLFSPFNMTRLVTQDNVL
jgi:hypothetical protein